jgi:hypothetical protein
MTRSDYFALEGDQSNKNIGMRRQQLFIILTRCGNRVPGFFEESIASFGLVRGVVLVRFEPPEAGKITPEFMSVIAHAIVGSNLRCSCRPIVR